MAARTTGSPPLKAPLAETLKTLRPRPAGTPGPVLLPLQVRCAVFTSVLLLYANHPTPGCSEQPWGSAGLWPHWRRWAGGVQARSAVGRIQLHVNGCPLLPCTTTILGFQSLHLPDLRNPCSSFQASTGWPRPHPSTASSLTPPSKEPESPPASARGTHAQSFLQPPREPVSPRPGQFSPPHTPFLGARSSVLPQPHSPPPQALCGQPRMSLLPSAARLLACSSHPSPTTGRIRFLRLHNLNLVN